LSACLNTYVLRPGAASYLQHVEAIVMMAAPAIEKPRASYFASVR